MGRSVHLGEVEALDEAPPVSMEGSHLADPDLDLSSLPAASLDEQLGLGRSSHEGHSLDHLELAGAKVGHSATMGRLVTFGELGGQGSGFTEPCGGSNTNTMELTVTRI